MTTKVAFTMITRRGLKGWRPMHGPTNIGTTAPERTPVREGQDRRRAPEAERNAQSLRVMGREVVVAVTNGRQDGFALLTRTSGAWERVFYGEFDGRRCKRVLVKSRRHSFGIIGE